jgi:peptidoglycan/xylan/chitin deacetylase (PgdA/CDA1 family)/GT2 family glycosyltransferase
VSPEGRPPQEPTAAGAENAAPGGGTPDPSPAAVAVAVVITCFDLGRTLRQAVASVHQQTQPAAELLVVDDGSTDPFTRQELAALEREGVPVESIPHGGVAAARNHGVRRTTAPLLLMLDADDELTPQCLERMTAVLAADPSLAVVSCALRSRLQPDEVWTPPPLALVATLAFAGLHVSSLFRRTVWAVAGGFDEELEGHEDLDFWVAAAVEGFRGVVLPEPLVVYGVRRASRQRLANRRATYLASMAAIHAKHRRELRAVATELLLAKDVFLHQQQDHARHLDHRRAALADERAELEGRIAAARAALARRGEPTFDAGELRRTAPLSPVWGIDRGLPVDRHYIEAFLDRHRADIRGRVLEVKDGGYTRLYGGDRVERSDVLDVDPGNPAATLVADLARGEAIPTDTFDCFILTQTLGLIFDVRAALGHALRVLRPGGVLLATLPAAGRLSHEDRGLDGDYWRFGEAAIRELCCELLPPDAFTVRGHGNVLATSAFLYGLAAAELGSEELAAADPYFPVVYTVRAVKPVATSASLSGGAGDEPAGAPARLVPGGDGSGAVILLYHRVGEPSTEDPSRLWLPAGELADQLAHLRAHHHPLSLAEVARAMRSGRLPERAVAITFDDGGVDALAAASPLLLEMAVPATFFVTSDRLDDPHEMWWDVLDRVLLGPGPLPGRLELGGPALLTATLAERRAARRALHDRLLPLPQRQRAALIAELLDASGQPPVVRESHRALLGREIAELAARAGHEIGGHSVHHLLLPVQPAAVRWREVALDKATLEERLGGALRAFAYPFGGHDDATVATVRECGYRLAVTTEPAMVRAACDPLRLPRLEAARGGGEALERQLAALRAAPRP